MGYGVSVPRGSLPVFSVDTEEEARRLLVAACPTNLKGEFVAAELVHEQTLENLEAFSDRLATTWEEIETRRIQKEEKNEGLYPGRDQ